MASRSIQFFICFLVFCLTLNLVNSFARLGRSFETGRSRMIPKGDSKNDNEFVRELTKDILMEIKIARLLKEIGRSKGMVSLLLPLYIHNRMDHSSKGGLT